MKFIPSGYQLPVAAVLTALFPVAGAPSAKVRSDTDPGTDMARYQTCDFFSKTGVEGENYSNLLGRHFRDAISSQMDGRGYARSSTPRPQVDVSSAPRRRSG